jgi:hypothetical protein
MPFFELLLGFNKVDTDTKQQEGKATTFLITFWNIIDES